MKRGRGSDTLTGGTKDVNPQWLTLTSLSQTVANTFVQQATNLPISRLPTRSGRAMVMEVLKVWFDFPAPLTGGFSPTGQTTVIYAVLSTSPVGTVDSSDATVFAYADQDFRGAFTAGGSYAMAFQSAPVQLDLTDGAGHGILIATDSIYLSLSSLNASAIAGLGCKILYRWKEVSLEEYIGIVQSQQQPTR